MWKWFEAIIGKKQKTLPAPVEKRFSSVEYFFHNMHDVKDMVDVRLKERIKFPLTSIAWSNRWEIEKQTWGLRITDNLTLVGTVSIAGIYRTCLLMGNVAVLEYRRNLEEFEIYDIGNDAKYPVTDNLSVLRPAIRDATFKVVVAFCHKHISCIRT